MTESQGGDQAVSAPSAAIDPGPAINPGWDRGWRKWLAEIGVVVIGRLLALGAQQAVDTMSWDQKVKTLEGAIRAELSNDLGLATELRILHPCVVDYLDTLQAAVIAGDAARIAKLNDMGAP